jgi:hypothetical protein
MRQKLFLFSFGIALFCERRQEHPEACKGPQQHVQEVSPEIVMFPGEAGGLGAKCKKADAVSVGAREESPPAVWPSC